MRERYGCLKTDAGNTRLHPCLLGHIPDTHAFPILHALSRFIVDAYPTDEATPRLTAVIASKVVRLVGAEQADGEPARW